MKLWSFSNTFQTGLHSEKKVPNGTGEDSTMIYGQNLPFYDWQRLGQENKTSTTVNFEWGIRCHHRGSNSAMGTVSGEPSVGTMRSLSSPVVQNVRTVQIKAAPFECGSQWWHFWVRCVQSHHMHCTYARMHMAAAATAACEHTWSPGARQ